MIQLQKNKLYRYLHPPASNTPGLVEYIILIDFAHGNIGPLNKVGVVKIFYLSATAGHCDALHYTYNLDRWLTVPSDA